MVKIGITGGIGSGKSMVCEILKKTGLPVYDSDSHAKLLTTNNLEIRQQLTALFGVQLYNNNSLNKSLLSQIIFSSTKNRDKVNSIIHPVVARDFEMWAVEQNSPFVILESAILFESKLAEKMDKIIVVTAPEALRVRRVQQRSQLTEEAIKQRMAAQLSDSHLIKLCDFVIENDEQQLLLPQINAILQKLVNG